MLQGNVKVPLQEEAVRSEGTPETKEALFGSLRDALEQIRKDLMDSLTVVTIVTNDERQIVEAAAESVERVQKFFLAFHGLIPRAIFANMEIVLGDGAKFKASDLRMHERRKLQSLIPKLDVPVPDVMDWNTLAKPPNEMKELIMAKLDRWISQVLVATGMLLMELQKQKFFGQAQIHPDNPTVTRYGFFRHVVRHSGAEKEDRATTEKTERKEDKPFTPGRSWREVKTSTTKIKTKHGYVLSRGRAEHWHHTYQTKSHALPASSVRQPAWITAVIDSIRDPILEKNVRVLAGEMAREEIKEVDLGEQRWNEVTEKEEVVEEIVAQGTLLSPCILIGDLVLCGWSQRDLPAEEVVSPAKKSGIFNTLENLFKSLGG